MKDELRNCLTFDILFNAKEISGSIDPEKLMSYEKIKKKALKIEKTANEIMYK